MCLKLRQTCYSRNSTSCNIYTIAHIKLWTQCKTVWLSSVFTLSQTARPFNGTLSWPENWKPSCCGWYGNFDMFSQWQQEQYGEAASVAALVKANSPTEFIVCGRPWCFTTLQDWCVAYACVVGYLAGGVFAQQVNKELSLGTDSAGRSVLSSHWSSIVVSLVRLTVSHSDSQTSGK